MPVRPADLRPSASGYRAGSDGYCRLVLPQMLNGSPVRSMSFSRQIQGSVGVMQRRSPASRNIRFLLLVQTLGLVPRRATMYGPAVRRKMMLTDG